MNDFYLVIYVVYVCYCVRSEKYDQVRNDSFRTFANLTEFVFLDLVPESAIIRVCSCLCFNKELDLPNDFQYRQGINALAGMFLYYMPEVDAFYSVWQLIKSTQLYWNSKIDGVFFPVLGYTIYFRLLLVVS